MFSCHVTSYLHDQQNPHQYIIYYEGRMNHESMDIVIRLYICPGCQLYSNEECNAPSRNPKLLTSEGINTSVTRVASSSRLRVIIKPLNCLLLLYSRVYVVDVQLRVKPIILIPNSLSLSVYRGSLLKGKQREKGNPHLVLTVLL